jgi:putative thioredoxin
LNQVIALPGQLPPAAGPEADASDVDDPDLAAADDLLTKGDLDGAEEAYRKIVAARPDDVEAKRALGSVTLLRRTASLEPADVFGRADGSDDVSLNCQAADLELLAGSTEAAFHRLVDLVRRTSGDDREQAKDHLLELLDLVGNDAPEVLAARRSLASALF